MSKVYISKLDLFRLEQVRIINQSKHNIETNNKNITFNMFAELDKYNLESLCKSISELYNKGYITENEYEKFILSSYPIYYPTILQSPRQAIIERLKKEKKKEELKEIQQYLIN